MMTFYVNYPTETVQQVINERRFSYLGLTFYVPYPNETGYMKPLFLLRRQFT